MRRKNLRPFLYSSISARGQRCQLITAISIGPTCSIIFFSIDSQEFFYIQSTAF